MLVAGIAFLSTIRTKRPTVRSSGASFSTVRRLRERQVKGEIPRREYARHVAELKARFPLLGLPLELWDE